MTHIAEDNLLRYALDACDSDRESAEVAAHLEDCAECRARLATLNNDIAVIGGVRPNRRALTLPNRRSISRVMPALLRAAALVVLGVVIGYSASHTLRQEPALVAPAYMTVSPPTDPPGRYAVSDATGIPTGYYERKRGGQ